ncbi:serine protease PepA [Actinomadura sp. NBRC 104412]|uniref:S1C family serine protease n=1 Tax=Actinomadura sp. NBRC 104412 TaxID=3032203 RepID=UPI0024A12A15|nr:trypsin-like peptidase domain-containing protein [Actinomadura sp. NBRC 104412]GLZ08674.1 serine protease PepA [Actinomadura sp. NBRC 104412]
MYEIPDGRRSGGGAGGGCVVVLGVLAALAVLLLGLNLLDEPSRNVPPPQSTSSAPALPPRTPSGRGPGVVIIDTVQGLRNTRAAGTGILMDASGHVLTNNHVIQGATSIRGTVADNGRRFVADVLGYQRSGDIAVVRLRGASRLRPAVFGDSSRVSLDDPVTAIGNAGGKGGTPSVVTGTVTALDQVVTATDESNGTSERLTGMIETNAPIRPGDSGGPLLNAAGQVIGMNTAASAGFRVEEGGAERGFAIPSNRALTVARQIQRGEASATVHIGDTAMLGVQVRPVGGDVPGSPPPPSPTGALIAGLLPGTPAESAGLPRGGVIVSLDGRPVDSPGRLTDLLLLHHPGDTVSVGWVDPSGRHFTTGITLAKGPPQ